MTGSVVIPTRDKAASLRLTLRGLALQSRPVDEIVVVDDGSRDDTSAVLQAAGDQFGARLRIVRLTGEGRAAARNAGACAATGDIIVFLDDDILVPPGFLAAHLQAHRRPAVATALGPDLETSHNVVHGPLRELPGAGRLIAAAPPDPYRAALDGEFGRTVVNALERLVRQMADGSAPPVAPWLACVGANVSMSRQTWHQLGGYEPEFGLNWGCEDLELGYRLASAGAVLRLAPRADGIHLSHARPGRWDEHHVNLRRFMAKHPDPAVGALAQLLTADGSPALYLQAVSDGQPAPTT